MDLFPIRPSISTIKETAPKFRVCKKALWLVSIVSPALLSPTLPRLAELVPFLSLLTPLFFCCLLGVSSSPLSLGLSLTQQPVLFERFNEVQYVKVSMFLGALNFHSGNTSRENSFLH